MATPKYKTIQERFGFLDPDLPKVAHDDIIKWIQANIEDVLMVVLDLPARPKDVTTRWEPTVRLNETGGPVLGFIDFKATARIQFRVGAGVRLGESVAGDIIQVVFEAKTCLDTLGVWFRQINLYKEGYIRGHRVDKMPFVVVCPDDTHAETLREQGILFLKYDPATPFALGGL
jgi:hypothetical protein